MKKRLFAGLLTAVLLVSLLPVSAFASEDEQNSGLTAAEQTETTQAAEMPEAELDIQNVPAEAASSESSSVDVTDFSFMRCGLGRRTAIIISGQKARFS